MGDDMVGMPSVKARHLQADSFYVSDTSLVKPYH